MLVHRRVSPSIKFAGIHLYTWVERGTMVVKLTNHEATLPPTKYNIITTFSEQTKQKRDMIISLKTCMQHLFKTWKGTGLVDFFYSKDCKKKRIMSKNKLYQGKVKCIKQALLTMSFLLSASETPVKYDMIWGFE